MKKTKKPHPATKIAKLAADGPKPLQATEPVSQAAEKMKSLETENFPVAVGDKLVGTIEGQSPDRKVAGFGHDPTECTVEEAMTKTLVYCRRHQSVAEARELMEKNHLLHLPVVDDDFRIIGVISLRDLNK